MKLLKKLFLFLIITSCANIVAPNGGDKDINPPNLISISEIKKTKHIQKKVISFEFDEFVVLNKWPENFYISPPVKKINKQIKNTELIIEMEDTFMFNTSYYLSLNNCIKDLNEGNILDSLSYTFSTSDFLDTLSISGTLKDAYSLESMPNCLVMLFNEEVNDTLIFKQQPNYIAKTNKDGNFHFPNLKDRNYKIFSLTEFDHIYNLNEKISFFDSIINPKSNSFVQLFAFNPMDTVDSKTSNISNNNLDSLVYKTSLNKEILTGKIEIVTAKNTPCILQLLQNNKIIKEQSFLKQPFLLKEINPGVYKLKYIADNNQDGKWNTGSWEVKQQAEKVINYPAEITIRSNWDLELEWTIEE